MACALFGSATKPIVIGYRGRANTRFAPTKMEPPRFKSGVGWGRQANGKCTLQPVKFFRFDRRNFGQGSAKLVNRTFGRTLCQIGFGRKSGYFFGHCRSYELIEGNMILAGNFTSHGMERIGKTDTDCAHGCTSRDARKSRGVITTTSSRAACLKSTTFQVTMTARIEAVITLHSRFIVTRQAEQHP